MTESLMWKREVGERVRGMPLEKTQPYTAEDKGDAMYQGTRGNL